MEKLYVEQRDGRYRFILRYHDPKTGKVKRIVTTKDKYSKQIYNDALRELQDRAYGLQPEHITLDKARELYIKDKSRSCRKQTVIKNDNIVKQVNNWLDPDTLITQLTLTMLKNALLDYTETNCAYNEKLRRYRVFLKWCYSNELIDSPWYDRLTYLPDNHKERIEDKFLEPDELQKLLDGMNVVHWYYVTYFLALSGLRIGELVALEDKDIDDKYIHVNKTYSLMTHEVGPTKTDGSTREVFIQDELSILIRKIRLFQKEYKFERAIKSNLFICSPHGDYFSYDAYRKYLHENAEKILGRGITPHALRHTCASILFGQGVPLDVVSRRLGHSDSDITKEIYIHVTKQLRERDESILKTVNML